MARLNSVNLIGRIQSEPEIRYPNNGVPIYHCLLRVPRPNPKGRKANDPDKKFDDINVIVWGDEGERAYAHTMKGSLIGVSGWLHSRRYSKENNATPEEREKLAELVSSFAKTDAEQTEAVVTEILDILSLNGQETHHVAYEVCAPQIEFLADCPFTENDRVMIPLLQLVRQHIEPNDLIRFLEEKGIEIPNLNK